MNGTSVGPASLGTGARRPGPMKVGGVRELPRLWRTARHLRSVQIYGRVWHRLHRPKPDLTSAPPLRKVAGVWRMPAARAPSMTGPADVVFLHAPGRISSRADWDRPERDLLWRYNLHYFDDLNTEGAAERAPWHADLMARWIVENPPGRGTAWHPYPLSLRIVNWAKAHLSGRPLSPEAIESLAAQTRYLRARLEWHLLGNHLFVNAKALVIAGTAFDGSEADRWRETGLAILAREVPEQILDDGGHFELSPMYHALILDDLLDLLNLAAAFPGVLPDRQVAEWQEAVGRMRAWLAAMTHPDGGIAFFNDAAFGIAPEPAAIEAYAERLDLGGGAPPGDGITTLPDSGYVRVQARAFVAILDVARIGPDYLPGHAHADTLSFELSLDGRRVIVNSGTSLYGTGPERLRQRSTAAHSTVEVDGESSSEVWSGFRVARRARPLGVRFSQAQGEVAVEAAHTGYRRLPGRVTHSREWRFSKSSLSIADRLEGRFASAVARFFLHPSVSVEQGGSAREGRLTLQGGRGVTWTVEGGAAALVDATWHPEFGVSEASRCLQVRLSGPLSTLTLEW